MQIDEVGTVPSVSSVAVVDIGGTRQAGAGDDDAAEDFIDAF